MNATGSPEAPSSSCIFCEHSPTLFGVPLVYDSGTEREFARRRNERTGIKLFVKLPAWFKVETHRHIQSRLGECETQR